MSLHVFEILSFQTLRFCRFGKVCKRNWLNSNMMVSHAMCILRKTYMNFWFMMCNSYKKIVTSATQALLQLPSSWLRESTFLMLLEIKSKLNQNIRT